ncbi:MAG: adenylyltransferase/cytidyltransferase family protein [bacterium]
MKTALFIGRFQPLHLGHIDAIKQILGKGYKRVVIGLGSSQEKNTRKNPFDLKERQELIKQVLSKTFPLVKFEFLPIPDFANSKQWLQFILEHCPSFDTVFTGNPYVEFCFKESDKKIEKLNINLPIKATNIRYQVAENGQLWEGTVPLEVAKKLNSKDSQKRFKNIFKGGKKNSPKGLILVVEKYTDLEFLQKQNFDSFNPLKSKQELEKNHFQHIKVKQYVVELLQEQGFNHLLIKEDELNSLDFSKYRVIMTLGGDGTFLHAAKMATNQLMIGVNTNPDKSVGLLTNFNIDTINRVLNELAEGNFKIDLWQRLTVKINHKKLNYLALNEVFIGVPEIYKSSKLEIKIDTKQGLFSGNGLIISTFKGSTGFYKSAAGKGIIKDRFGYANLLPFLKSGDLEYSQTLSVSEKIVIMPERAHHVAVFDGDESRQVDLKQGDKLEVFVDPKKCLKVLV